MSACLASELALGKLVSQETWQSAHEMTSELVDIELAN